MTEDTRPRTPWEVIAVWVLLAADLAAVAWTYARVDPERLYHVVETGLRGGLSRAVVLASFPIALIAIALALIALANLPRRAWLAGGPTIVACAVTAWPGVVDQDDLSAKWVNVIPAPGVAGALGLTIAARTRARPPTPRLLLDAPRLVVAALATAISIPWLVAEVGHALPDGIFLMQRLAEEPGDGLVQAVHLGHHHGLDGLLILLSGLALSRPRLRPGTLDVVVDAYLALAVAYGSVNLAQDAWHEQLVKRGWLDWQIPSALQPGVSWIWAFILLLAAGAFALLRAEGRAAAR